MIYIEFNSNAFESIKSIPQWKLLLRVEHLLKIIKRHTIIPFLYYLIYELLARGETKFIIDLKLFNIRKRRERSER